VLSVTVLAFDPPAFKHIIWEEMPSATSAVVPSMMITGAVAAVAWPAVALGSVGVGVMMAAATAWSLRAAWVSDGAV
jgi:hypothetical protein